MVLKSWSEIRLYASLLRSNFERGAILFFPDISFFTSACLPFSPHALDRIEKIKTNCPRNVPAYIMIKDIKLLPRFVFMSPQEWFIFNVLMKHNIIFLVKIAFHLAKKSLIFPGGKIGLKVASSKEIGELLDILGGVCMCVPVFHGGKPVLSPQELERLELNLDDLDILFLIQPQDLGGHIPTVVEVLPDSVSVLYEGTLTKYVLSEMISKYGFRII